jgi:hypothetical protein
LTNADPVQKSYFLSRLKSAFTVETEYTGKTIEYIMKDENGPRAKKYPTLS